MVKINKKCVWIMQFLWIIGMDFMGGYAIIHIVTPQYFI